MPIKEELDKLIKEENEDLQELMELENIINDHPYVHRYTVLMNKYIVGKIPQKDWS